MSVIWKSLFVMYFAVTSTFASGMGLYRDTYRARQQTYNQDVTNPTILDHTKSLGRQLYAKPSKRAANNDEKRDITGGIMQEAIIHYDQFYFDNAENKRGNRQDHREIDEIIDIANNFFLAENNDIRDEFRNRIESNSVSKHYAIIKGIRLLSNRYTEQLWEHERSQNGHKNYAALLGDLKNRETRISNALQFIKTNMGVSEESIEQWFIEEWEKLNRGINIEVAAVKDHDRQQPYWWNDAAYKRESVGESKDSEPKHKIHSKRGAAPGSAHTGLIQQASPEETKPYWQNVPKSHDSEDESKDSDDEYVIYGLGGQHAQHQDFGIHRKLDFAERMALAHLDEQNGEYGTTMQLYINSSILKKTYPDGSFYIENSLFGENPTRARGEHYGLMGKNALHLRYVKWNRDNLARRPTSPGFLGLQRGKPYNLSHELLGRSVLHDENIQQFIKDAENAFARGYISYTAIVRNEHPSSPGGQHYHVIFVTKNDDNTLKDAYVFNPTGTTPDLQSIDSDAYKSILLALQTKAPEVQIHEGQPVLKDNQYRGDLNAIATGLQSGMNACGITATIIAEYLVTLPADKIKTRADVIESLQEFQRRFGYKNEHLNERGLFDPTKLSHDEREGGEWVDGFMVDREWVPIEPYFQPGTGKIIKHGDHEKMLEKLVENETLFGDETVKFFNEINDIANGIPDFSAREDQNDQAKQRIFKDAINVWMHRHQIPADAKGVAVHRKVHFEVKQHQAQGNPKAAVALNYAPAAGNDAPLAIHPQDALWDDKTSIHLNDKQIRITQLQSQYGIFRGSPHKDIMENLFDKHLKPTFNESMDTEEYRDLCHRLRKEFAEKYSGLISGGQPQAANAPKAAVALNYAPAAGNDAPLDVKAPFDANPQPDISDLLSPDQLSAFNERLAYDTLIERLPLDTSINFALHQAGRNNLQNNARITAYAKAYLAPMGYIVPAIENDAPLDVKAPLGVKEPLDANPQPDISDILNESELSIFKQQLANEAFSDSPLNTSVNSALHHAGKGDLKGNPQKDRITAYAKAYLKNEYGFDFQINAA